MTVSVAELRDAGTPAPEPYDFRRPAAIPRARMRRLESAFDVFADRWSSTLGARVHGDVSIELTAVLVLDYREVVERLRDDDAVVLCAIPGVAERGTVRIPASALLGWVARVLGASSARVPARTTLTPLEQPIVRRILEGAFDDLRYAFADQFALDLGVDSFPSSPRLASAARPDDAMLVATFQIEVDGMRTALRLALPVIALTAGVDEPTAPNTGEPAQLLRAQVVAAPVDLALRLRPAALSPAAVLGLAVGDVLSLPHPHHRPLDLAVDGQIVAHAAIGTQSGNLACVVVDLEESE
ncbi:flagellar motor switch protein FliM [Pseudolysinimonas sp.]|jgi:flagellar motor switch protein FliM